MKSIAKRSLYSTILAFAFFLTTPVVMADGYKKSNTILDKLVQTDGAQAVVAAVLVVDEAGVLHFSLADVLGDKNAEVVLLAPGNAAFEKLLGLDLGTLNGLSIDEVKSSVARLVTSRCGCGRSCPNPAQACLSYQREQISGRHQKTLC